MIRPPRALLPFAALLGLYLVAPLLAGLARAGAADWHGADWPALLHATLISVGSASCATLLAALFGIPLGFVLAATRSRLTRLFGLIAQLPLALPPLASGILLLFLFGYATPLGRATGGRLTESFLGIVLAECFVAAPFLVVAARESFAAADPGLADAARSLGLGPLALFLRIQIRQAAPGLVAGALLTWLRGFGEFGATMMVAYHPYSLPVYTFASFGVGGLSAMLPVLLPTLGASCAVGLVALRFTARQPPAILAPPPRPACAPSGARAPACCQISLRRQAGPFSLAIDWSAASRRLAILGASGSGKSLTLRAIAGLDGGAALVALDGQILSDLPPEKRAIGYVPQGFGLLPHVSGRRQIALIPGADLARARTLAAELGIESCLDRMPASLSLGQCQRLALVRALARPDLRMLLLDEPFSALDAPRRRDLRARLATLQAGWSGTTILVTHDPDEACALADHLLLLDHGAVLQSGPVDQVWARPANALAARLLGAEPLGSARISARGALDLGCGVEVPLLGPIPPAGAPVGFAIPPHAIRITPDGRFAATCLAVAPPHQGMVALSLRLGQASLRALVPPPGPAGQGCRLDIAPESLQLWPVAANGADA